MLRRAPALHGGPRSSTAARVLFIRASTGSAGAARDAAAADRRETGGLHGCVVHVLPIVALPLYQRLVTLSAVDCVWGCPRTLARGLHAAGTPSPRGLHCSPPVRRQLPGKGTVVLERTGITYVYFYTTFDERTTKRRAGSPAADGSSEFSTALAGGRGAASASDALRWQAPRGGSSAPPFWWGLSSACPTQARAAQRRLLCTAVASRGVSWFGRALAACEGGIESRVRARGVGRSSTRASNVCRRGAARPSPAAHFASMALFVSAGRRQ